MKSVVDAIAQADHLGNIYLKIIFWCILLIIVTFLGHLFLGPSVPMASSPKASKKNFYEVGQHTMMYGMYFRLILLAAIPVLIYLYYTGPYKTSSKLWEHAFYENKTEEVKYEYQNDGDIRITKRKYTYFPSFEYKGVKYKNDLVSQKPFWKTEETKDLTVNY